MIAQSSYSGSSSSSSSSSSYGGPYGTSPYSGSSSYGGTAEPTYNPSSPYGGTGSSSINSYPTPNSYRPETKGLDKYKAKGIEKDDYSAAYDKIEKAKR